MTTNTFSSRDAVFDAIKGVLVILMVVYHVLSITTTGGTETFRYIRFISGSFIFIAGYVVARFMLERFGQSPLETSKRLVVRSLKVLLIFTTLNLAIHVSGFGNVAKEQLGIYGLVDHAALIYLVGDGRRSSFVILLPIAYLLLLSPLYLAAATRGRLLAPIALLIGMLILGSGLFPLETFPTLELLLAGLCGLCLGTPVVTAHVFAERSPGRLITAFGLPISVWLSGRYGSPVSLYCIGVVLVLKFMHDALRLAPESAWWFRQAVLMGQYSLMAYIVQIVLIQLLFRALGSHRVVPSFGTVMFVLAVALACAVICVVVDHLRRQCGLIDRTYRWVFA